MDKMVKIRRERSKDIKVEGRRHNKKITEVGRRRKTENKEEKKIKKLDKEVKQEIGDKTEHKGRRKKNRG